MEITKCLTQNKMILNINKTNCIVFPAARSNMQRDNLEFQLTQDKITAVTDESFSGKIVDQNLNWQSQISSLGKKLNQICYSLRVLKGYVSLETLKTVYYASFLSKARYGIIFWGGSSELQKLFVIQKQCLRVMTNIKGRDSCRDQTKNHSYSTRHNNYNFPRHRLSVFEKGPLYASMKFFNVLPDNIKAINHIKVFKREVYNLLLNIEPYSTQEYVCFRPHV
nr:unnamed protein product [Callosobruchus analis]